MVCHTVPNEIKWERGVFDDYVPCLLNKLLAVMASQLVNLVVGCRRTSSLCLTCSGFWWIKFLEFYLFMDFIEKSHLSGVIQQGCPSLYSPGWKKGLKVGAPSWSTYLNFFHSTCDGIISWDYTALKPIKCIGHRFLMAKWMEQQEHKAWMAFSMANFFIHCTPLLPHQISLMILDSSISTMALKS